MWHKQPITSCRISSNDTITVPSFPSSDSRRPFLRGLLPQMPPDIFTNLDPWRFPKS